MRAPVDWLKDYVDIDVDIKEYADKMTMSGSKVEAVERLFDHLSNVVVGRIDEIYDHPNADKLKVCRIFTGNETITVVTGAGNVSAGDLIPVALEGAVLAKGIRIESGAIRGVVSQGMMCSLQELGLGRSDYPYAVEDGIFVLNGEFEPGEEITEALGLKEDVVEFEITSNRPDCLSMRGIALESAVVLKKEYKSPQVKIREEGAPVSEYISVEIIDGDLCPVYAARVCTDVRIGPSPEWMRKRLRAAGVRPINNVVDITNYVMLEYGQPMHAFDIEYIKGRKITVRRAKEKEVIKTLDEVERELDNEDLVIADEEKAIALAGIMGGQNSEINSGTKTVVFESANFEPVHIRLTAKKVGLRTESSSRFEKGLDPMNAAAAMDRACQLMEETGAGKICKGSIVKGDWKPERKSVPYDPKKINRFLGTDISDGFMKETLTALKFEVYDDHVLVPGFRADVTSYEDLAEEIARFYDYNSIDPTLPRSNVSGAGLKTRLQKIRDHVRSCLTSLGYYEAYTFSFNSPRIYEKLNMKKENAVRIINPLGEDYSIMRTTAYDGMLRSLAVNYNRRVKAASLFELARVYIPEKENDLPEELEKISIGAYGRDGFFDFKGTVEELFGALGINGYEFKAQGADAVFHPGRCADIYISDIKAGVIGQIDPKVADNYDLPRETLLGVLDLDILCRNAVIERQYTKLPRYPSVNRDIAVVIDDEIEAGCVERMIRDTGGDMLEAVELFDVYKGKQLGDDKKSLAYSLTWRDKEKTLTDEDIAGPMEEILEKLTVSLGAELRQT